MNYHFETMLKKNKMTLIMSLPANKPELADAAWENGADVIKVHINVSHRASKTVFGNFDEEKAGLEKILERSKGPCGIVIGDNIQAALRDYPKAVTLGFDFISLYVSHAPPEILYDNKVLKMLALSCNDSLETASVLKTVGADILEASIMKGETYGQPLSAKELMQYAYLCAQTDLPVVVPTQRYILPDHVYALQRCGIRALMIGAVVTGKEKETISHAVSSFKQAINRL